MLRSSMSDWNLVTLFIFFIPLRCLFDFEMLSLYCGNFPGAPFTWVVFVNLRNAFLPFVVSSFSIRMTVPNFSCGLNESLSSKAITSPGCTSSKSSRNLLFGLRAWGKYVILKSLFTWLYKSSVFWRNSFREWLRTEMGDVAWPA